MPASCAEARWRQGRARPLSRHCAMRLCRATCRPTRCACLPRPDMRPSRSCSASWVSSTSSFLAVAPASSRTACRIPRSRSSRRAQATATPMCMPKPTRPWRLTSSTMPSAQGPACATRASPCLSTRHAPQSSFPSCFWPARNGAFLSMVMRRRSKSRKTSAFRAVLPPRSRTGGASILRLSCPVRLSTASKRPSSTSIGTARVTLSVS